jgi:hypothetical protein
MLKEFEPWVEIVILEVGLDEGSVVPSAASVALPGGEKGSGGGQEGVQRGSGGGRDCNTRGRGLTRGL